MHQQRNDAIQRAILGRVLAVLFAMVGAVAGLLLIIPSGISRLAVMTGYLGTTLAISLIIVGGLSWYRWCSNDEDKRHSVLVYIYVYLFAFLALDVVTLGAMTWLLLNSGNQGMVYGLLVLAIVCLVALWRVAGCLMCLTTGHAESELTMVSTRSHSSPHNSLVPILSPIVILIGILVISHYAHWATSVKLTLHLFTLLVATLLLWKTLARVSRHSQPITVPSAGLWYRFALLCLLTLSNIAGVLGMVYFVGQHSYDLMLACTLAVGLVAVGLVAVVRSMPKSIDMHLHTRRQTTD